MSFTSPYADACLHSACLPIGRKQMLWEMVHLTYCRSWILFQFFSL